MSPQTWMQIFQEFWNEKQKVESLITSNFLSGGQNSRQLLFRVLSSISAACRWKHETENGYLQVPIESLTAIFFIIFVHILVLCKPVIATGKANLYSILFLWTLLNSILSWKKNLWRRDSNPGLLSAEPTVQRYLVDSQRDKLRLNLGNLNQARSRSV